MPTSQRTMHKLSMYTQAFFRTSVFFSCLALFACSKPDYHTADGSSGRFADAHGKWLLINYWAEWCKPCLEEMSELNRFQQQHRDRVILLTVNYDGAVGEPLLKQIGKLGIELPVLLNDPAPMLGVKRPDTLPTTLVFDTHGNLHQTLQGAQTAATLAAAIDIEATPVKNVP
jgi:thiol-disulfide isomerase/thioredoxin